MSVIKSSAAKKFFNNVGKRKNENLGGIKIESKCN